MWGAERETPSKLNRGQQIFCSLIYLYLGGCSQAFEQQKHREMWVSWSWGHWLSVALSKASPPSLQASPIPPQGDSSQTCSGLPGTPVAAAWATAPVLGGSKSRTLGIPQRQTLLASSPALPWPAAWPGACFLTSLSFLEPLKKG